MTKSTHFDDELNMTTKTTKGIEVSTRPFYVAEESQPQQNYYFFAYQVTITNRSNRPARLQSRHWFIEDAKGEIREVQGEGVVGEKPYLKPGTSFEYTSYCPLSTPSGTMKGSYQMVTDEGVSFDVEIPEFQLFDSEAIGRFH